MRDNVSLILSVLIGSVVIVFIPVIAILQYQNNVTYNMALSLTTEFVEGIRQKGSVTLQEYEDFLNKLKTTSNNFTVEMEAHRQLVINDIDDNGNKITGSYQIESLVDYSEEILKKFETDNKYLLTQNDEIYVNVYNTNVTMFDRFRNAIFGTNDAETKKINISLGGKIFDVSEAQFTKTDFATVHSPYMEIELVNTYAVGGPKYEVDVPYLGAGNVSLIGNKYKKLTLTDITQKLTFNVTVHNIKNFFGTEKISELNLPSKINSIKNDIVNKNFIQTNNFVANNISVSNIQLDPDNDKAILTIELHRIYLSDYSSDALFSITIRAGLAGGLGNSLSPSKKSEDFLITMPVDDGPPKFKVNIASDGLIGGSDNVVYSGETVNVNITATDVWGISRFVLTYQGNPPPGKSDNQYELWAGIYSGLTTVYDETRKTWTLTMNGVDINENYYENDTWMDSFINYYIPQKQFKTASGELIGVEDLDKYKDYVFISIWTGVATDTSGYTSAYTIIPLFKIVKDKEPPKFIFKPSTTDILVGEPLTIDVEILDVASSVVFKNNVKDYISFVDKNGHIIDALKDSISTVWYSNTQKKMTINISQFPDLDVGVTDMTKYINGFSLLIQPGLVKDLSGNESKFYNSAVESGFISIKRKFKLNVDSVTTIGTLTIIKVSSDIPINKLPSSEDLILDNIIAGAVSINKISGTNSFQIVMTTPNIVTPGEEIRVELKEGSIISSNNAINERLTIDLTKYFK